MLRQRRNDRDGSLAFKDSWINQEGNSTGDLAGSSEIARVWRLGRRLGFSCIDGEDPLEERGSRQLVSQKRLAYSACVSHTSPDSPQRLIGMCDSLTREGDSRWRTG
jgi:hypothetical protein